MSSKPPSPMVLLYFLGLLLLATFLLGRLLWPFVAILILSYLLTTIFAPVYAFFNKKFSPQFASLATCGLIVVLIFVPMVFFVGTLSSEAYALFQLTKGTNLALKFTEFVEQNAILAKLKGVLEGYGIQVELKAFSAEISNLGRASALFVYNQASAWAANILNFIFDFPQFMLFFIYYKVFH